jgi:predicted  nucleic acid-binding Zn-ribbon protein
MYEDGANEILQGCPCGGKFFFFIKKEAMEKGKVAPVLTKKEKEQIEEDVYDLIGEDVDRDKPVVLDIESINILKPGVYELDLIKLFKKKPLIYKLEEGKYFIDLAESFKHLK